MNIETLEQMKETLDNLGYEVVNLGSAIGIRINEFVTIITIENCEFHIQCEISTLGNFSEEAIPMITYNALNANSRIRPYAFEIIDSRDDPQMSNPKDFILVIADTLTIGDLSVEEVEVSMQRLHTAINECRYVLNIEVTA